MREVLFRGQDAEMGKWVTGDLISYLEPNKRYGIWTESDGIVIVIPKTIRQFTGLTDKNGLKIFDGDICAHRFKRPWRTEMHKSEVVWNQAYCCYYLNDGVSNRRMRDDMEYEVIGNAHNNKDILK